MPCRIAIASGKGGTGKTTVSVNLFHYIQGHVTKNVQLVDCDVEEPNVHVFFTGSELLPHSTVNQLIPQIDTGKCTFCRKCVEYCEFNAIVVIPPVNFAEVNNSLCHSCGACLVACEEDAIHETFQEIGTIAHCELPSGGLLTEGRLKIGSAMQTMMIREVKKSIKSNLDLIIYDAPPGTGCPVVETLADADYVILVTEPTPFGVYDLRLTVDLLRVLNKSFGVVINKSGTDYPELYNLLLDESIELLGEIPFNREYAARYANGDLIDHTPQEITKAFTQITDRLILKIDQYERNYSSER